MAAGNFIRLWRLWNSAPIPHPSPIPYYNIFMPILDNPRHENFAIAVAKGQTQEKAYINAGFSPSGARANANRMIANDSISQRIQELQADAAAATNTDLISLIGEFEAFADKAQKLGHFNAALRAMMVKAKLLGFL